MWTNLMRAAVVLLALSYSSNVSAHSFKDVVKNTIDSVCLVEFSQETVVIDSNGNNLDENPFEKFKKRPQPIEPPVFKFKKPQSYNRNQTSNGVGTCFVVSINNIKYLITNDHVANSAPNTALYIGFKNNLKHHRAIIVGTDKVSDIAVLKMETTEGQTILEKLTPLKFGNSDHVVQGEQVIAIGHPLGQEWSITQGIVSSVKKRIANTWQEVIQSDVSINQGNSGGPLLDANSNVIGINSFILSPNHTGSIGVNFSVTSNRAVSIINTLIEKGKVKRGKLGLAFILDKTTGLVIINGVEEGGPMALAGFRKSDIIQKINGVVINRPEDLGKAMDDVRPLAEIEVQILRDIPNVGNVVILKTIITNELTVP